jgi:hypothetical protein
MGTGMGSGWRGFGLAAAAVLAAGCSGRAESKYAALLVPAAGRVTIAGQPLAAATILFIPLANVAGEVGATAFTDADGRYNALTPLPKTAARRSTGMVPGRYRVVVQKLAMPDGGPVPADMADSDALAAGARNALPGRYSAAETTPLEVEVPAGGADGLDLDIKR